MTSIALNPSVLPWLVPAIIAVVVLVSFAAAVLAVRSRFAQWSKNEILETLKAFASSEEFELAAKKIFDPIAMGILAEAAEKISMVTGALDKRVVELELRDGKRAETQKGLHGRVDDLQHRFADLQQWTGTELLRQSERLPPRTAT